MNLRKLTSLKTIQEHLRCTKSVQSLERLNEQMLVISKLIFVLYQRKIKKVGAHIRNRTEDLFLTMELLYQLSYMGSRKIRIIKYTVFM